MAEKRKPVKFRVNKDYLLSLLHKREYEVLLSLKATDYIIVSYLEDRKYTEEESEAQILEIIVEIVSRVCSIRSEKLQAYLNKFLRMLTSCEIFLFEDIPRLLYAVVAQEEKSVSLITFMVSYMIILKVLLRKDFFRSEKISNEIFPTLENYMNRLRERGISDLSKVEDSFRYLQREVERLDEPADTTSDEEDFIEDFRNLSIVPRLNDIVNCEIPDNIPQNIIDRPYKNVDHYLSVHYRLTREDMLRSFRECVKMSLSSNCRFISKNNIYDKVTVLSSPKYNAEGVTYEIKISASQEIDWGKKEVLIPGGLVFLTPDDFNSVVFATVFKNPRTSHSKSKEICIKIKLEDDQYNDELFKGNIYKMIEPNAYFECYKHVLSAIKDFSENTFPLSDIITYFNFADLTPKYMDNINKYCLHESCDAGLMELDGSCSCKVFDPSDDVQWPSSNDLKLDDMQYIAFKTALTKKVAVIQGPPGTGKTYIGVKVVKSLLINVPHKPIVICCLTNHALDQFLERMLDFTKKVVRLGGQSKSEVLEPNKIDNMIYAIRQHYDEGGAVDDTLKKSIDIVRKIAPELLKQKSVRRHEHLYYDIADRSNLMNKYLDIFSRCQDKFLDDSALNEIIDSGYKNQLRLVPGAIRKSLSAGLLEWLNCSRATDLYEKCRKKFEQFKKRKDLNCTPVVQDVWTLTESKRYELFYCWREKCLQICKKNFEEELEIYKTCMRNFKDKVDDFDKLQLVNGADIIGVTTTGACKFREFLRNARPHILVIEEAAQVLESHVIASLLPSIQHLIMIGDHEQLRPLPADHELSERYNLSISMFERLFDNKAPSATLVMQHRMKPCIAELLVPRPYALYTSAEKVYKYEEIKGVETSVFFFDHRHFEDKTSSGTSSSNDFEAQMVVSFAKYLTFIQYSAKDITIIATYAAQVLLILRYLETQKLSGIKVTTVDNYQGEENDIILISFVRSNETVIGFLKESNRVCVALSRARKGMFCFGNFQLFADKNELWHDISEKLRAKNMIGNTLSLKCFRHLTTHPVNSPEDILGFLSKGCSEDCNFELPCKHLCSRKCHFMDPDHLYYSCKKPCEKLIDENRVCPRLCYEKCKKAKKTYIELPCGHQSSRSDSKCYEEVPVRLPCAHVVTIPCYMDVRQYSCKAVVNITLDCGHVNSIRCFEQKLKNDIICTGLRQVVGPCGHTIDIPCSMHLTDNQISSLCNKACGSLLDCGHPCVGECRFCFDTGIHAFCRDKCDLTLSCGHRCEGYCGSPCPPCKKKCFLKCGHTFCINDCLRPCIECKNPCERVCIHKKCTKLCWESCNVDPCMEPCEETLPCGHRCIGFCGDSCPYLCRVCNTDDLLKYGNDINARYIMLECNHVIEVSDMKELLNDCLESFEWPSCPQCTKPVTQMIRFKKELKLAKNKCTDSFDTSKQASKVQYLVESMYGVDYIVPASFMPVHKEIQKLLKQRNPQSHILMVLNNCVVLLRKLYAISSKINESDDDSYIQEKFDTLMLWIRKHLTNASFQQLRELKEAVQQLESEVSSTTRLRLGDYLLSG